MCKHRHPTPADRWRCRKRLLTLVMVASSLSQRFSFSSSQVTRDPRKLPFILPYSRCYHFFLSLFLRLAMMFFFYDPCYLFLSRPRRLHLHFLLFPVFVGFAFFAPFRFSSIFVLVLPRFHLLYPLETLSSSFPCFILSSLVPFYPSIPAGSRWIELVFNKRECIKFIPSSKDNARCCCGQLWQFHRDGSPATLRQSQELHWSPSRHTQLQPTDAYGTLEFQGGAHPTKAQV
ncbi:putative transient receptor potential cation channel trpm [Penaeus vannamei]|uniref:Putative transient receptor potential cation channel trpm n=1 Tax=Penaeus vannamei TaxID=6689 RepID=A0A423T3Y9_PENVA|nr:putative transient receptor potential cation channel trpm [Penaeus vannamei]